MFKNSYCGSGVTNAASIHEDAGSIPGPYQWVKNPLLPWVTVLVADMAGIWCWLQLWHWPAPAAPIWFHVICQECSPKNIYRYMCLMLHCYIVVTFIRSLSMSLKTKTRPSHYQRNNYLSTCFLLCNSLQVFWIVICLVALRFFLMENRVLDKPG